MAGRERDECGCAALQGGEGQGRDHGDVPHGATGGHGGRGHQQVRLGESLTIN